MLSEKASWPLLLKFTINLFLHLKGNYTIFSSHSQSSRFFQGYKFKREYRCYCLKDRTIHKTRLFFQCGQKTCKDQANLSADGIKGEGFFSFSFFPHMLIACQNLCEEVTATLLSCFILLKTSPVIYSVITVLYLNL